MPKSVFCKIDLVEFSETPDVLVLIPEACGKMWFAENKWVLIRSKINGWLQMEMFIPGDLLESQAKKMCWELANFS